MSSNKKATPSGIIITENNERVIPASKRPDGTYRKERRVRSGFTPQEDIERYKNRNVAELEPAPESDVKEIDEIQDKMTDLSITSEIKETIVEATPLELISKKIKALEKKIRQIDRIKEKEATGKTLLEEEKNKLNKLEQIKEELEDLKRRNADLE
ncbi:12822_t:CDS:2 [Acaulospora morrowiae]|uniref:12822_t:CDS:1 n=1 Tax=Acaulospora morrowiae TaxID=94023 RepID=A0A9N9AKN5_9GLOM|nr:12822_t:CDS:2 [Acaulospora morrowiae]